MVLKKKNEKKGKIILIAVSAHAERPDTYTRLDSIQALRSDLLDTALGMPLNPTLGLGAAWGGGLLLGSVVVEDASGHDEVAFHEAKQRRHYEKGT